MIKVLVTGPESAGKSTLCEHLAKTMQGAIWVREYARAYIDQLDRPYQESDLVKIAQGQIASEAEAVASGADMVISDTGMEVMKVWALHKYQRVDPWITQALSDRRYDLVILCKNDIPWAYDPQREYPDDVDRQFFMDLYMKEVKQHYGDFLLVEGELEDRVAAVQQAIAEIMQ
ncbi:AAA family ATPase [Persicobacter psychrovividus]|uniref:Nicotinamide-nucleotide adenylyltransferase n=1 Tax=Persicobacter psychrovividus TaxID=387638 RepID=A0ABN6LDI2_9BACT|nr:nicotinamide-nucleotide adenylyltransferase [Persicobacter psychrovividus]